MMITDNRDPARFHFTPELPLARTSSPPAAMKTVDLPLKMLQ